MPHIAYSELSMGKRRVFGIFNFSAINWSENSRARKIFVIPSIILLFVIRFELTLMSDDSCYQ